MSLTRKPVVLKLSDGIVAISSDEFEKLLDASNILRMLVYGHEGMSKEENLDIFEKFGIRKNVLNVIRKCISTGGILYNDKLFMSILTTGELRDACETLGGFPIIDSMLEKYITHLDDVNYHLTCVVPRLDIKGIFEWRCVPYKTTPGYDICRTIKQISEEGYNYVYTDEHFYHFRQIKIDDDD